MDVLSSISLGFSVALQPLNLLFCLTGVFTGTLIGVLPGIGPVATLSLLLPFTYQMEPVSGIIMLAGIFYGAMYGGSTTSILVNMPGEAASIVTCFDGYQMARQGRAGQALGIAAIGSFIAGSLGVIGMMFFAPVLGRASLRFGPPEFFALSFLGLTLVTYLSRGSAFKAIIMAILGLLAGTIGMDPVSGEQRFTFGSMTLTDGLGIVPVAMGIFGVAEVLENIGLPLGREIYETKIKGLLPSVRDLKESLGAIFRGTFLGFFLGMLPGPSGVIASLSSYAVEKRVSKCPEKFGTGVIQGVAGPESANNAATAGAFIPLLSLGIPANITMAIFMGALMIHGIQPGPLFITKHPDIFWGVVASMYIGNAMLLVLNLPMIGIWVKVLRMPYAIMFPIILLLCVIGVFLLNGNVVEVFIMIAFGILGVAFRKTGFDGAPFLLAMVLGPLMENSLKQSLFISRGSFAIFSNRPISACLLTAALVFLVAPVVPAIRSKGNRLKQKVEEEI